MLTSVRPQTAIIILTIVLAVASGLLFGIGYGVWHSQVEALDNLTTRNQLTTTWAQQRLDREITSAKQAVSLLANLPSRQEITQGNMRQQLEMFSAQLMTLNPAITEIRYVGISDNQREIVRVERRRKAIVVVPEQQLLSQVSLYDIPTSDSGHHIRTVGQKNRITAINRGERLSLQISLPTLLNPLEPFGVVMVTYDISEWLQDVGNDQTGFAVVLDSQGSYSLSPEAKIDPVPEIESLRQLEPTANQWRNVKIQGESYRYLTRKLWLDEASDTSLTLVQFIPENEFSSALRQGLTHASGIILFVILALVVLRRVSSHNEQHSTPEQSVAETDTENSNIDPILEQLVAERTEALNEALRQAEAATEQKSQFLAKISHELRTPLNGLGGMLAVLHRTPLSGKAVGYLDRAEGSLSILKSIVDDILDLTKIEAGVLEMETIEFDLLKVLDTCCHSYSANAEDANTRLFGDFTGVTQPMVIGDPTRLHQILAHLIGNAMRFTKNGRVTVEAKTHVDSAGQLLFTCRIEDNGIGMARETLHQVFKALAGVYGNAIQLNSDTALGLSICGSLIQLLKGTINVESKKDEGTAFTLLLPLTSATTNNEKNLPDNYPAGNLSESNILVMTQNSFEARLIENTLRQWQCQVIFSNPEEFAISIRKPGKIDLLIISPAQLTLCRSAIQDNLNNPTSPIFKMPLIVINADDLTEFAVSDWPLTTTIRDPLTSSNLSHILAGIFFEIVTSSHTDIPSHRHITGKLLIVDDVESNRALISAMLDDDNVEVIEAENGKQALEVLRQEPDVGLVLMDCQMPLMGGLEATEKIRQGEAGPNYSDMPIVALTAAAMEGEKEACLDAGMNDYMAKPFEMKQLLSMVDAFLTTQTDKTQR